MGPGVRVQYKAMHLAGTAAGRARLPLRPGGVRWDRAQAGRRALHQGCLQQSRPVARGLVYRPDAQTAALHRASEG